MVFNSLAFLVFFILIVGAYFICPLRFRWAVLLVGSCYFYMALVPYYILILFFIILVDFFMAKLIEKSQGRTKRIYLVISIIANLGTLFFFKYFNFFNQNVAEIAHLLDWNYPMVFLRILLPLGLSFHTFQSLSYIIEVYRGKYKAENHLGIYALYVMFFPQLVAGPIERPAHLLPQLHSPGPFRWDNITSGLQLMAWGFFKKIVIADRLAVAVNYIYASLHQQPGPSLAIAVVFFAFQLYADFSGYSDIAKGSARVLGFDLTLNFNHPYFSKSVADFWRRWHISLSSWLRDYVYFPLVYSAKRVTRFWLYICLFITFLISGIWHGAGWNFVAMGALFGAYLVLGLVTRPTREWIVDRTGLKKHPALHLFLQRIFTFVLVCLAWIFFRVQSVRDCLYVITHLFFGWNLGLQQLYQNYFYMPFTTLGITRTELLYSIFFILLLLGLEWIDEKAPIGPWVRRRPLFFRVLIYSGLVLSILVFGNFNTKDFIYFQF